MGLIVRKVFIIKENKMAKRGRPIGSKNSVRLSAGKRSSGNKNFRLSVGKKGKNA
jgi:hypothetical protein